MKKAKPASGFHGKDKKPAKPGMRRAPGKPAESKAPRAERPTLPDAAMTGTYQTEGAFGYVTPDDRREIDRVMILQGSESGARNGDKVIIEMTPTGSYRNLKRTSGVEYIGKVLEVLGAGSDPKTRVMAVIRRLGLRYKYNEAQLQAADQLNQRVTEALAAGRPDLRERLLVTIDGEDTRDIDDAVSLEKLSDGQWRLGVHIADVAHYVKEDSILDREAFARGNSVYFPDSVLPMLPAALSNGICSLNAGVDRLAMSCIMTVNSRGRVVSYTIEPTLVRIREKLNYAQVQGYLNRQGWSTRAALKGHGSEILRNQPEHIYFKDRSIEPMLLDMAQLCLVLRKARLKRGSIDFDFPESKIKLDDEGNVIEVGRKDRMLSEMIIEEFMILANETVATHYFKKGVPFLYRVHETPPLDGLRTLNTSLAAFGLHLRTGTLLKERQHGSHSDKERGRSKAPAALRGKKASTVVAQDEDGETIVKYASTIDPHAYQELLEAVKDKPEQQAVSTLLLRSLAHARYSPLVLGHFGLASPYYSHFTSPIRRYPDLAIHRIIKKLGMEGKLSDEEKFQLQARLERYAEQTSLCERVAEDAERKVDNLKKAEYMSHYIGEEYDGVISGVTSYGLYIALPNTVEGMAHISTLQDYYEFDEARLRLSAMRTRKSYTLGQKVKVRVTNVDLDAGYVDFQLIEAQETKVAGNGKASPKGKYASGERHAGKAKASKKPVGRKTR